MKSTVLKALLLPIAFLALGGFSHASAAPACLASYTMTAVTAGTFSCTIGDLTFSNFAAAYTPTGGVVAPDPTLDVSVNFAVMTSGPDPFGTVASGADPIYTVITDYTGDNSVAESQTLEGVVQYMVTDTGPAATSIIEVDGAITGLAANTASGSLNKNICSVQFGSDPGPDGVCPGVEATVTDDLGLSTPAGQVADGTPDFTGVPAPTSMGVYDGWSLAGGSSSALADADVTAVENDFIETGVTPEPGTFVLFGGALLGLSILRRRRKVA
jgi:hypothetical protein